MSGKGYIICKDKQDYNLVNFWVKKEIKPSGGIKGYERSFEDLQSGSLLPKNVVLAEGSVADVVLVMFSQSAVSWSNQIPVGLDEIHIEDIPAIAPIYTQKILKERLTELFKDPKTVFTVANEIEATKLGVILESLGFTWGNESKSPYSHQDFAGLKQCVGNYQIRTSTGGRAKEYPLDKFNIIEFKNLLRSIGFNDEGKKIN